MRYSSNKSRNAPKPVNPIDNIINTIGRFILYTFVAIVIGTLSALFVSGFGILISAG
mgnify:CR=1 FL=1